MISTAASKILDSVRLLSFVALPFQGRAKSLYDLIDAENSLADKAQYLNLGYWVGGASSLDAAGEAMADLMAKTAGLSANDEVLDVGFGFADQDIFWNRIYGPKRIVGLNLNERQVLAARLKTRNLGISNLEFVVGDAVKMPFSDGAFDVVFALESAFHFRTRDAFFSEAFRVLRPGGRLVMVDLTGLEKVKSIKERVVESFGRSFWQIPKENLYSRKIFADRLICAGFKSVSVESIWHDVYPPFILFAQERLKNESVRLRMNPAFRTILELSFRSRRQVDPEIMDYVLAVAEKPNAI